MFNSDEVSSPLPALPPGADLVPLDHLYLSLTKLFGNTDWLGYEPETIQLHLGRTLSPLSLEKLNVIKVLLANPTVQDNASFILHACTVVNNDVADFEAAPHPTSLELAHYVKSVQGLLAATGKTFDPSPALKAVTKHVLVEEGYSEVLPPFQYLPEDALTSGQTDTDTAAKKQAIEQYLEHMEDL